MAGFFRLGECESAWCGHVAVKMHGGLRDHANRLSIREDENPVAGNSSRFLPHAIL